MLNLCLERKDRLIIAHLLRVQLAVETGMNERQAAVEKTQGRGIDHSIQNICGDATTLDG